MLHHDPGITLAHKTLGPVPARRLGRNDAHRSRAGRPVVVRRGPPTSARRRHGRALLLLGAVLATTARPSAASAPPTHVGGADVATADGHYGVALAWSGEVAAVGAAGTETTAGATYLYRRDGAGWHLAQVLRPLEPGAGYFFGASVAVSGSEVAVGAWGGGAVELFSPARDGWARTARLAPAAGAATHFGAEVALQGDLLVVGAEHAGAPSYRPGAVHLYRRARGEWREAAALVPIGLTPGALFGSSIALAGDVLAVGAMQDAPGPNGSGAVYVYRVGPDGADLVQRLSPPPDANAHYFGGSVAVTTDVLAIGAPGGDYGDYRSGPVFLYRRVGAAWEYLTRVGPLRGSGERFGVDVALSGAYLLVAVATDNGLTGGRVQVLLYSQGAQGGEPTTHVEHVTPQLRYVSLAAGSGLLLVGVPSATEAGGSVYAVPLPAGLETSRGAP